MFVETLTSTWREEARPRRISAIAYRSIYAAWDWEQIKLFFEAEVRGLMGRLLIET